MLRHLVIWVQYHRVACSIASSAPKCQNQKALPKGRAGGGSDRARTITYDFSGVNLYERQEIVDPIIPQTRRRSQGRYSMSLTQIPEEQWEEVAQRHAGGDSLRQLAKWYGVSHEAVRQIVIKVKIQKLP
jgi:hypothetical protein